MIQSHSSKAVVARIQAPYPGEEYLTVGPSGQALWTRDIESATPFESVREATRTAVRMPSAIRAFGLPIGPGVPSLH